MTDTGRGRKTLVVGGARSGKSRHAQSLAERAGGDMVFIATAQAFDGEMRDRIARHRADRDQRWRTVEAPVDLARAIAAADAPDATIFVDCLTLWASNLLLGEHDVDRHLREVEQTLAGARGRVLLVTNEVGWGIVPDNALARRFRDIAGRINQAIAARADEVILMVAGIATTIKESARD
ncbi:adenosylcobinamide kinase /adenosylcobinamide-phosphate guanylyltransferase [Sphingomonas gellani]|uniref:Bifunctional adenosylcobalamin biosynthesis protein n=1 Tax=Sphingomonas gellani TaxID=1166340 RepID=A0A1H8CR30_9SPHN|nr:bifunctional adenosylcobinamide kinase/adenosylcobinamide-phosphate guanylyltransferase [Sphingomonas gellani]SEM97485.1 adenosylcobinamide kinase /adenosylcobinamide-phosphate guanylyltransferase [Sphingomonas gellani]